jgi:hypothetical protein
MQNTVCDVCRKKVEDAAPGRSFFYYGRHGVCEACKDGVENQVRTAIRKKDPYTIEWYDKFVDDTLEKAIQKGKI